MHPDTHTVAAHHTMQQMHFSWVDPLTDQRWMRFIAANAEAGIFLHPAWLTIIGAQCRKHVQALCLMQGNSIHSAIPLLVDKEATNRQALSIPFLNGSGSILPATADTGLEQALITLLHSMGITRCTFRDDLGAATLPRVLQGYIHRLDISGSVEDILHKQITQHCQRSIRKAEGKRLEINVCTDYSALQVFHRLHILTRRRQGLPAIPFAFFMQCHENLISRNLGCIIQVTYGKRVLSSGIFAGHNNTFSFKYGASDSAFSEHRPNHAMLWHAIQYAKRNGYSIFDLGRCELSNGGLRRFKLSWGASEYSLFYSYYPTPPPVSPVIQASKMILQPLIRVSPKYFTETLGKIAYTIFPAMLS